MNVKTILAAKGGNVVTIEPTADLAAAGKLLTERHIGSGGLLCVGPRTIGDLMGRMTTGKFRHMPVVRQGKLIGIVSIGDVVKNRVEEIEHESEALRDYIQTA